MKKTTSKDFVQFMVDQVPVFDEMIIRDIRPTDSCLVCLDRPRREKLRIDIRLLPNRARRLASKLWDGMTIREASKSLGMTYGKAVRLFHEYSAEIDDRLYWWLQSLPQSKRRRELRKRPVVRSKGVSLDQALDRFSTVYPKITFP